MKKGSIELWPFGISNEGLSCKLSLGMKTLSQAIFLLVAIEQCLPIFFKSRTIKAKKISCGPQNYSTDHSRSDIFNKMPFSIKLDTFWTQTNFQRSIEGFLVEHKRSANRSLGILTWIDNDEIFIRTWLVPNLCNWARSDFFQCCCYIDSFCLTCHLVWKIVSRKKDCLS